MHQTHAMAQVEATQQSASSWLAGYPFKLLHRDLNAVVGHAGDVPVVVARQWEWNGSVVLHRHNIDNDGSNCCTRVPKVETVQSHHGTLAAALWQSRSPR